MDDERISAEAVLEIRDGFRALLPIIQALAPMLQNLPPAAPVVAVPSVAKKSKPPKDAAKKRAAKPRPVTTVIAAAIAVEPPAQAQTETPAPYANGHDRHQARLKEFMAEIGSGLQPEGHDQWRLPEPEPILVHGEQIWPTNDRRYDWRAAYYAFNLWRCMDDRKVKDTNVVTRGHFYRNPIGPILSHINGPIGVVIQKIGDAMIDRPNDGLKTRGPGKLLQGR